MALIAVGDVIPEGILTYFDEQDQLQKVIIFGVPGAFTPTCSLKHVPGFIEKEGEMK
uniref:Glutaredoxin-dependent peroxiredoxin n=1 Tax=Vitis vinifera TaxID=29760 RepID=F6HY85_VITVI